MFPLCFYCIQQTLLTVAMLTFSSGSYCELVCGFTSNMRKLLGCIIAFGFIEVNKHDNQEILKIVDLFTRG